MHMRTKALVLRETAYKESDKILTLLTQEAGKLTASARGCRKKGSAIAAGCQLLVWSDLVLYEYRGRWTVQEVAVEREFRGMRQDLVKFAPSLIIPRLPFPVPDPIREAQRPNYMTLQDYIQAVIVPEMQVKLRQGFGRAIRTETDTCVVSILDHRAAPGGKYHREVTEALPSVPVTRQIEDVERFIRARKGPDYFFVQRREAMCLKTEKCARGGSTVAAEARA